MFAKEWYKSKTLWVNIVAVVSAVGIYFAEGETDALVVAGLGLINFILRFMTDKPIVV